MTDDFDLVASRATEPLFYRAPHPEGVTPYEYQLAGVEYHLARDCALFGDAPGLGKTAETILLGNAIRAKHTLVICPASLRLNWEREVRTWSTIPDVSTYPVLTARDGVSPRADYVITSYAMLLNKGILDAILDLRWDHLILDEAHALKDPKGNKRTKIICAPDMLPRVCGRITMASGTILPNQPIECLGADTLVLTDRGWRALVNVELNDLLWDGGQWVKHKGLVCRGTRKTIDLAGVSVTPDHILLSDHQWQPASKLARNENMLRRALVTATENLPSWAWNLGQEVASYECKSSVTVTHQSLRLIQRIWGKVVLFGAAVAGRVMELNDTWQLAPMIGTEHDFSFASPTLSSVARIQTNPSGCHMGGGISKFGRNGHKIVAPFWLTSYHWKAGIIQHFRLTEFIMTVIMRLGTFVSQAVRKICRIDGVLTTCNSASPSLKLVYDLVNAGPRQRFTIWTDRGPLIAHNCYNALRLLNWDAIDCASLADFREEYYALGEGMVRGPVLDPKTQVRQYKLHWSKSVRNVPRNLADLQRRLRRHIMVRRLKEQCLGANTLVLTDIGWVPILRVAPNHKLWDGTEWVCHDGLMRQGKKLTINLAGVSVTPSHAILIGQGWVPALEARRENMMRLALATATENLPSQVLSTALKAALEKLKFSVLAKGFSSSIRRLWRTDKLNVVVPVLLHGLANLVPQRGMQIVLRLAQIRPTENVCWAGLTGVWSDANREAIKTTLVEEYSSTKVGKQQLVVSPFFSILRLCPGGTIQICKSTELIMKKVMSQGIFGLLQGKKMRGIEGRLARCKNELMSLKPVFDIANAGPRQRFTILTDRGPLIVHNCLHELPEKQWHLFPLEATGAMRQALKHEGWARAERLYELDPNEFRQGVPIDGAVSTARRLLGEAKAPAVTDYIKELLESGVEKVVVAAWHHSVLDFLRDKLTDYRLTYMDGSTSTVNKQAAVDRFQLDPRVRVILGQTIPLGEGWTLSAAQDVVLAEPDWVPGKNDQVLERTHRIGQRGDYVLGHIPVVPGTLDERILGTVVEKDRNIYAALDEEL